MAEVVKITLKSDNYEGRLKSSRTGGSSPPLCRGRPWLLYQYNSSVLPPVRELFKRPS